MKNFTLLHDPGKKTLIIPGAALQLYQLSDATHLNLLSGVGCMIMVRQGQSVFEKLETAYMLHMVLDVLVSQMAKDTQGTEDSPGGFEKFLTLLECRGVSMAGLHDLLEQEAIEDE